MSKPSRQELFLQNSLARASVLLFRATKGLDSSAKSQLLLSEIEVFFSEMCSSLSEELKAPATTPPSPTSVKPVDTSGAGSPWVPAAGTQYPYHAVLTGEEVISSPCSGGITPTDETSPPSFEPSPSQSFAMRLKSVLTQRGTEGV